MTRLLCLLLIGCIGELYGQEAIQNSTSAENLVWKSDYKYAINPHDTAYGFYNHSLRSLTYSEKNKVLWTIDLPERMTHYVAASIYDKRSLNPDGKLTEEKIKTEEIDINNQKEFLKCPEFISKNSIAISDNTGFLLLDKSNGHVLIDIPEEISDKEHFYVDSGQYEIKIKKEKCYDFLQHGAEFTAQCSQYLFHFNGSELFVFNMRHRLVRKIQYSVSHHSKSSKGHRREAVFYFKQYVIEIAGVVYFR